MPSKVNPISKGSWGRYYTIHKPVAPASESLLITFQIQSTGNKQQPNQAAQPQKLVQRWLLPQKEAVWQLLSLISDPALEMLCILFFFLQGGDKSSRWLSLTGWMFKETRKWWHKMSENGMRKKKKGEQDDRCLKSVNLELEQQREMDGEIEREDDRAAGCRDTDWGSDWNVRWVRGILGRRSCLIWLCSLPRRLKIYNDTITVITSTCSHVLKELSALNERPVTLINPDRL